jgi:hypothetical protein
MNQNPTRIESMKCFCNIKITVLCNNNSPINSKSIMLSKHSFPILPTDPTLENVLALALLKKNSIFLAELEYNGPKMFGNLI